MKSDIYEVKGSKGDPDPPRTPIEDPNTLQSRAVVRFIDLLCEGEVEGLVNGEESIYFNNIPIRNEVGLYNFDGLSTEFKPGAPDGISLREYPTSESEISVDTHITQAGGPISRSITSTETDDLRLTFTIPSLFEVNSSTGDIKKTTVEWLIEIKASGGSWVTVKRMKKYGKCISAYQTDYRIKELERNYGVGPWEVRCIRITPDSESNSKQYDLYWSSYTQIINRVLIYPDSSLIGVTLNSQQFGSRVPQRSYNMRGLRIQIPSNYNPVTRTYSGIWDGTFIRSYCNNPAWVYYDMLNNDRYGIGLESQYIDKWSMYAIAQYNDGLVDDGFGGKEPRFTFNGIMQSRTDAVHALNMIASTFRCMPYWAGGQASISQDSPKDSVKLVTAANVVDGLFTYSYSADENRYTIANVTWNDPSQSYKLTIEPVDDRDGLDRYGYRPADITAIGCTSRGQAYRFGRWFLYTSLYETETVTYRASWDQVDVLPGQVITVLDNHEAATRHGGRVVSVGSSNVTLDSGIVLESGETYTITCIGIDGTLLERDVTDPSNDTTYTTLNVDSAWPAGNEPQVDSVWIVSATNVVPKKYRVISINEVESNIFEITGLIYDENKYAAVEDGKIFSPAPVTKVPDANSPLAPPTNIQLEKYTYEDTGGTSERADRKVGVLLSWTHTRDTRFQNYEVQWKISTGSFADNELIKTTDNQYDIKPFEAGEYTFRVRATGLSRESLWLTLSEFTVDIIPNAPPDITGLTSIEEGVSIGTVFNGKDCEISWDELSLTTDTTSPIVYDGTSIVPTHAAPFDSELTKIRDYQIEVLTPLDVHLRYEFVIENKFKYFFGINTLDNGTPIREIKFKVWARDVYYQLSENPATIIVENPIPTMSGLTPTIDPIFTGLKVDWTAITPTDNDMSKFKLYLDTSNPPTTLVAEVGVNTNTWVEAGLEADVTYRAQIEPYDEFGVGVKSDVSAGVPLKISGDDIDIELQQRLVITDSLDSTDFSWIYDHVYDTGGGDYDSGDWIKYEFPTEQLIDRVTLWASQSINCYFSISNDHSTTWTFYKAQASHELDGEGMLVEATNEADAITNYWTTPENANGDLNQALYPNGLAMTDCRIHFLTNGFTLRELLFTDQVIAEWIVANQLSAISADLGVIAAGTLQSTNLDSTAGVYIDLNNEIIKFGGLTDPALEWDGAKVELSIADEGSINVGDKGSISVGDGGDLTIGDGGYIQVGNTIEIDSAEDTDARIIVTQNTTKDVNGRLVLSGVDYMQLDEGNINFLYWDGSQHQTYKSLVRIETGVAQNNTLTYIPGIFKETPKISISPNVMNTYDSRYPGQSQKIRFEIKNLKQYSAYKWRFKPRATLDLASGVAGTALNITKTHNSYNAADFYSNVVKLPSNARSLSVGVQSSGRYQSSGTRHTGGKDGYDIDTCTYFNIGWYVRLYCYINNVWQNMDTVLINNTNTIDPFTTHTSTLNASSVYNITHFRVLYDYYATQTYRGRRDTTCTTGYREMLKVVNYSTSLGGASILANGSLNWTAIGA